MKYSNTALGYIQLLVQPLNVKLFSITSDDGGGGGATSSMEGDAATAADTSPPPAKRQRTTRQAAKAAGKKMKAASSDRVTRLSAAAADTAAAAAAKAKERETSNEVKDDTFVFGQNAFKAHDKNKKFKPGRSGKQKITDMIDNKGKYKTSAMFECKGREHGLTKCHPVCAFAHTRRHIMVEGKWKWVNLCAPCEAELFHQVEQFNYTEDIVKKQTEQTFAWEVKGKEEEMKITICGGNPNILSEFIPDQFLVTNPNDLLNCGSEYLTPESLKDQINNLITKKIFVQHYPRGLFSSGLVAARTMKIMDKEEVFKSILDYFGRKKVKHVWCQLASKDAFQQFHADSHWFERMQNSPYQVW